MSSKKKDKMKDSSSPAKSQVQIRIEEPETIYDPSEFDSRVTFLNRLLMFDHVQVLVCKAGHVKVRPRPLDGDLICNSCHTVQTLFDPNDIEAFNLTLVDLLQAFDLVGIRFKIDLLSSFELDKFQITTRVFNHSNTEYKGTYLNHPYDERDLVLAFCDCAAESIYKYARNVRSGKYFIESATARRRLIIPANLVDARLLGESMGLNPGQLESRFAKDGVITQIVNGRRYVDVHDFYKWYKEKYKQTDQDFEDLLRRLYGNLDEK